MGIRMRAKAQQDFEAGVLSGERLPAATATHHEELQKDGGMPDAPGPRPSSKRWRIRYSGGMRSVTDGPFAETKELIAGYSLIEARSREEAIEWFRDMGVATKKS